MTIRPSNSGMATFIAVSSGPRPRPDASQARRLDCEVIAWKTGASSAASCSTAQPLGVGPSALTPPIAKLIVLMIASQPASLKGRRSGGGVPSVPTSSFDETEKTGRASALRRSISRTSASTNPVLPASRCAR